jgi:hypothetical protein
MVGMRQYGQLGNDTSDFKAGNQIELYIASIASITATIHVVWSNIRGALDVTIVVVVTAYKSVRKKVVVFGKSWAHYAHGCSAKAGFFQDL